MKKSNASQIEAPGASERIDRERATVLDEIAQMLSAAEPLEEFHAKAMPVIRRLLPLDFSMVQVPGATPGSMQIIASDTPEILAAGDLVPFDDSVRRKFGPDGRGLFEFRSELIPVDAAPHLSAHGFARVIFAPLERNGELLGIFVGARRENRAFTTEERAFLSLFAAVLTQVIVGRRQLEQLSLEADEQQFIAAVAEAVGSATKAEELAGALVRTFTGLLPCAALAYGYLEDDEIVVPLANSPQRVRVPIGPYMRVALAQGQIVLPPDMPGAPPSAAVWSKFLEVLNLSFTAAEAGGKPCGLLIVGTRDQHYVFSERDLRIFRVTARILGPAMASIRALEEARAEAEEERLIADVARAAARAADPAGLVEALQGPFGRLVTNPVVGFGYLQGGEIVFPSHNSRLQARLPMNVATLSALDSGQACVPDETLQNFIRAEPGGPPPSGEAWLTAAQSGGLATGLLFVAAASGARPLTPRQLHQFRVLADIIGPAMANVRSAELAREEADEQRIIAEISAAVAMEATPAALVQAIHRPFGRVIPNAFVHFAYLEGTQLEIPPVAGEASHVVDAPDELLDVLSRGQIRLSEASMAAIFPPDDPSGDGGAGRYPGAVATVARNGGVVTGILFSGSSDLERRPTPRQLKLFRLIAQIIGPAMANVRAAEMARLEAEEQRLIAAVASVAARESTPEALLEGIVEPLRGIVPHPYVAFGYFDGDSVVYRRRGSVQRLPRNPNWNDPAGQLVRVLPQDATSEHSALERLGVRVVCYTAASSAGAMSGMLVTGSRLADHRFTPRTLRIFRLVAQIVGPAIANALAAEKVREEAEEQRIIAEVAAVAARESTPESLVDAIVEPLRSIIPRPYVGFGYFEGDSVVFPRRGTRVSFSRMSGWAHARQQLLRTYDPDDPEKRPIDPDMARLGVRVVAYTLASSGGATSGMLVTGSRVEGHHFSERDLRIFRVAAQIVGPAMANALAAERARQEAEEQRTIAEIAAAAARESDPGILVAELRRLLEPFVPLPSVEAGYVEGGVVRWAGSAADQRSMLSDLDIQAVKTGQTTGAEHACAGGDAEHPAAAGCTNTAVTRMASGGELVGILSVVSGEPNHVFSERELRVFRLVAQILGPAFANASAIEAMERENELHTLIVSSLSEAVLLFDYDLRVVFENAGGAALRRAVDPGSQAETIREVAAQLPPTFRQRFFDAAVHGERTSGREAIEVDGEPHWFDYENIPLEHPEHRLLFVASDVTAEVMRLDEQTRHRQQLEQSARLAALGELISGVAHELNNPLTAILGFADMIAISDKTHPFHEEVDVIRHEAARARNIVRDLLDIARPSPAERAPVQIGDLFAYLERIRRPVWSRLMIDATVDARGVNLPVWADSRQITQVLLNLVTNAEHALEGSPDGRISITAAPTAGGEQPGVVITVSDNGAGMDEPTAARIFEPFFTTKHGIGNGLGLSLSYSIVASHRGKIEVHSKLGSGTTFAVTLPSSESPFVPLLGTPAIEPARRKARILVIDDEPNLRKLCQRLIASMGHDCSTADSPESALALVAEGAFDLILCDYRLGSETADAVVDGLAATAPHLVSHTVIATGATSDTGVVDLCTKHNLRVIAKPYGADEIADIVASVA